MSYRLEDGEGFSEGIRRIVLQQIDKALDRLKSKPRGKDEAIHDARVCIKKIRALLRLVSGSLGGRIYKAEDTAYRDTARTLSRVRDNAAMLEIVDKLIEHFSHQLSKGAFAHVRAGLVQSRKVGQKNQERAMRQAAKSLRQARQRVKKWPKTGHHRGLTIGLKRVFKRGRVKFSAAYDQPTVDSFHEWRKQVKHLLYETRVLRPLWYKEMRALGSELRTLGKYLSEDHDLAILRKRVLKQLDGSESRTEVEALVALIDQRRNELHISARPLGARLYAEKPGGFAARTEAYWQAWRSEVKVDPIAAG